MVSKELSSVLDAKHIHLVGIKGVAMTALSQCLLDAGIAVTGSDIAESFVTQDLLTSLPIQIFDGFDHPLPDKVDYLVYTAAHRGVTNPLVVQAQTKGIPVLSQAEAQAQLFNAKKGVAVCGVGGKSTVTAMIVWILEQAAKQGIISSPSYSVGVGSIPGLTKTGRWAADNPYFIAEADEYVADPTALERNEPLVPKFLLLYSHIAICTNIQFDHPDVYQDFEHTKRVFKQFFSQIKTGGVLIYNQDDEELKALIDSDRRDDIEYIPTSTTTTAGCFATNVVSRDGKTTATVHFENQAMSLSLQLPGSFNIMNALTAIASCIKIGVPLKNCCDYLAQFKSTKRRFEFIGQKNGVSYYDDYAHHPHEVRKTIDALNDWFPTSRKITIFQPHTFSRTKQLFNQFVQAFAPADEIILTDIFASAREGIDPTISSTTLEHALISAYPDKIIKNLHDNQSVAEYINSTCANGDVVLTIGAGDVYHVHDLITE